MGTCHVFLPPEITEMVIDRLHDDRETLSTCSLVNKSWRTRSQYHIYRTLTITVYGAGSLWKSTHQTKIPCIPFPGKSTLVEELHIQGMWHDATITCETLGCIIKCLPQLRVLCISSVHLSNVYSFPGPFIPPDLFSILPQLAELRSLSFSNVTCEAHEFNPPIGSPAILDQGLFVHLEEFVCDNSFMIGRILQLVRLMVSSHTRRLAKEDAPRGFNDLRRLTLRLARSPFQVNDDESLTSDICSRLLQMAGSKLEHLSLVLSDLVLEDIAIKRDMVALVELCKGLGISSCSQLKSITFRLPAHVGFAGHDDAWLAAAACLHLIPPSAPLETLNVDIGSCFIMSGHVNPDAQKSILRYLDDAAHSLPFLRRVIIVAASDSACKVDDKMSNLFFSAVRSHLPKLQEKVELIIRDVV